MSVFLSKYPNADRLYPSANMDSLGSTNELLVQMGLVYQVSSGFIMLSPLLQMIQDRLEDAAKAESLKHGFQPLGLPFIMPPDLLKDSGKYEEYQREFYHSEVEGKNYLFAPTTEEAVVSYLKEGGLKSYKQLPMRFYHPHHVFRHIERPEGIFKSRDFKAILLSSFDQNIEGFRVSMKVFSDICDVLFTKWGIETLSLSGKNGEIIEHLFECDIGDRPLNKGVIANRGFSAEQIATEVSNETKLANISMGYEFDRVSRLGLRFADNTGSLKYPIMGTFCIGIQRCLYALLQKARNGATSAFNSSVRPFDLVILPIGDCSSGLHEKVRALSETLESDGIRVAIDDRNSQLSKKFSLADFFSIPVRIPISTKDIQNDDIQIRQSGGRSQNVPYQNLVSAIHATLN